MEELGELAQFRALRPSRAGENMSPVGVIGSRRLLSCVKGPLIIAASKARKRELLEAQYEKV